MSTLFISRDGGRSIDRRRAYRVVIDGTDVGELPHGVTRDFPVKEGTHVLSVAIDHVKSRQWSVMLAAEDVVNFSCRSRSKHSNHVDLFLTEAADTRAAVCPPAGSDGRDLSKKQRVITRDGQVLHVWAHRSGYLRTLDPGSASNAGDDFLVEVALYVLVLPVLAVLRRVRHHLLFRGGWSVGAVRSRRFLWPKKVRLERLRSETEARARAAQLIAELEGQGRAVESVGPLRTTGS